MDNSGVRIMCPMHMIVYGFGDLDDNKSIVYGFGDSDNNTGIWTNMCVKIIRHVLIVHRDIRKKKCHGI
jgi:hypothetical protein